MSTWSSESVSPRQSAARIEKRARHRSIPLSVRVVKRGIDIALGLSGMLVLLGVGPLIALAIRVESPGPVLYRQRRVIGVTRRDAHGHLAFREFDMLKFRSMRMDAEKVTGAVLAEENDPRITRVGRILRKTRLDELPQLWHVLEGDMSLVGPRPERPELLENLALAIPFFEERLHDSKPGLTGYAQVSLGYAGRIPEDSPAFPFAETLTDPFHLHLAQASLADDMRVKLLYDLAYATALESFWTYLRLELLIIFKTPWVMLRGVGR